MSDQDSGQDVQQEPNQQGTKIPITINQPSGEQTEDISSNKDKSGINDIQDIGGPIKFAEKWMIFLTAALVFVSILQWSAMRSQLEEVRREFTQDQRPYVMPTHVEVRQFIPGQRVMVDFRWVNYGKSPALRTSGRAAIFFGMNALEQADKWFEVEAPKPFISAPERVVPPGIPSNPLESEFSTIVSNRAISPEEFPVLMRTNFSIVVVTRQVYFDGAGNRYWTDSCFSNLAGSIAMPDCPKHNGIN